VHVPLHPAQGFGGRADAVGGHGETVAHQTEHPPEQGVAEFGRGPGAALPHHQQLIVRGLVPQEDVQAIAERFDDIGRRGEAIPGHWQPNFEKAAEDVLARYPRVMQPHRFDPLSFRMMLHPQYRNVLADLLGDDPIAAQSMFYFKPPGARGQTMHQDNDYLRVKPATCLASWLAVDRSYPENGGLWVSPRTQHLDLRCPERADTTRSFTPDYVAPPEGSDPVPANLEPGDVLFFNGSVIHGSSPNGSEEEWRRSFICHYIPRKGAEEIAKNYFPLYDFEGSDMSAAYRFSEWGGPCGEEVDVRGQKVGAPQ
jgi:hypothetical protein